MNDFLWASPKSVSELFSWSGNSEEEIAGKTLLKYFGAEERVDLTVDWPFDSKAPAPCSARPLPRGRNGPEENNPSGPKFGTHAKPFTVSTAIALESTAANAVSTFWAAVCGIVAAVPFLGIII
jgi:hypothetical protein